MFNKYIFPQLSGLFLLVFCLPFISKAGEVDSRNDSFYVSHYTISMDLSNLALKTISGNCEIKGVSRIDKLNRLSLELYKLTVDSVFQKGKKITFLYNDSLLNPALDQNYNTGDSFDISIYYHGHPLQTSWGGFYFDPLANYAFNLGVSLYDNPHNFGRIWFPCVDNFIDKALFSFYITTKNIHKCYCNGLLKDSVLNTGNTITWHWEMNQPIPPYLASVAVGNYKTLYSSFTGKSGKKPVLIGVIPADSVIAKTTFQHLPQILAEYESYYAPYAFDRVGFVGVNFSAGAMEHASNIALPNSAIESGLSEESLWAHELSHHWWGDLMTCKTAADMWLNEGWASFNESMYQEKLYGTKAYNAYARSTHYYAIRYAHEVDNGDRALSPMPTQYTYGPTVYKKGADVARTLRAYLGDTLFFKGIQTFIHDYSFKSASSDDFKNSLSASTGVDMTGFFQDWVYSPGWPHFKITSLADNGTSLTATVSNRRVNNFTSHYDNTPLEITWFDAGWNRHTLPASHFNLAGQNNITVPRSASFVALDIDGKITDATTKEYKVIKAKGSYNYTECLTNLVVDSLKDSALVYVVHNWIGADRTANTPKNIKLSTDRYWTVDGIFTPGFHAQMTMNYDGRTFSNPYYGGYLDNNLLKGVNEDSIVLMYKSLYGGDWIQLKENIDYIKTTGGKTDDFGNIKILNLKRGEYCLGIYDYKAGINEHSVGMNDYFDLFPNPASNSLHINIKNNASVKLLQVFDTNGRQVKSISRPSPSTNEIYIRYLDLGAGSYILQVTTEEGVCSKKFIVER
jgi:hypothetical protein